MQVPTQVTFHGLTPSGDVEAVCAREIAKLEVFHDRITSCRVVVDLPHRRHRKGNQYAIRVDLTVPGGEIIVNREAPEHQADEVLTVAVREAFDTARRQLQDFVRKRDGRTKHHEPAHLHGRISKLEPLAGYGFARTPDGREVYFHEASVQQGRFVDLAIGMEVDFHEEQGAKGAQASWIRPTGEGRSAAHST